MKKIPDKIQNLYNTYLKQHKSWENEFQMLKNEITLRQYSLKTLKSYTTWVRRFHAFLKSKSPRLIESMDAKEYITPLP